MIRGNAGLGRFSKRNNLKRFFYSQVSGFYWCLLTVCESICRKMHPLQSSRIDLGDLKAQIAKKLGADRSKWYFYHLNLLLSQKLSKNKFDKLCLRVLGKENLLIHNQFIRSILKNACHAKTPPPLHVSSQSNPVAQEDDYELSGPGFSNQSIPPIWSNGVLPVSPQKGKSGISDWKLKDRHSLLGANGKVEYVKHQTVNVDDANINVVMTNGDATSCDYQRPVQRLEAVAELPESNMERFFSQSAEKPGMNSKFLTESTINEDMSEMERSNSLSFHKIPLIPPLGIPCYSTNNVGGAGKAMPFGGRVDLVSYYNNGELSDNETLRRRMDQIVTAQSLEGVSTECANVLNSMLNMYLKRMISSCIELVGARSKYELKKHLTLKPHMSSHDLNIRSNSPSTDITQEQKPWCSVSLLDFKIAMELNPKQLGEDWPMMLEKICTLSFEE